MYLVKALGNAEEEDFPGSKVKWTTGQTKYVHESLIERYRNNPAAWAIVATPDASPGAGTLVQNNAVMCDATNAANSFKQLTAPANAY